MPPTKYELRDAFIEDIQKISNLYTSLSVHAINSEKLVLAEQTIVSLIVTLESFVSELLVTLILENSNLYLANLSQEMKTTLVKVGYSQLKIKFLTHDGIKKIKDDDLREIILNDGDNLAFPETRMLKEFIEKNLPRDLAFDVTPEDDLFIDLLKSTRNLCAHHSQKSARTLTGIHKNHFHNIKVNGFAVCRALVQDGDITMRNIGEYLRTEISPNRDRVGFVSSYLREMVFRWIK